jgi:hypothetical protein
VKDDRKEYPSNKTEIKIIRKHLDKIDKTELFIRKIMEQDTT